MRERGEKYLSASYHQTSIIDETLSKSRLMRILVEVETKSDDDNEICNTKREGEGRTNKENLIKHFGLNLKLNASQAKSNR